MGCSQDRKKLILLQAAKDKDDAEVAQWEKKLTKEINKTKVDNQMTKKDWLPDVKKLMKIVDYQKMKIKDHDL